MRQRRSGFTFIELITVIAIIAILAAILFPVFAQAREKARQTSCASNLHQIAMAMHLYAQDHNGRFPPADDDFNPAMPYIKNLAIFRCPSDPHADPERLKIDPNPDVLSVRGPQTRPLIRYSSYAYRGGLRNDDWGDLLLASDRIISESDRGADGKLAPTFAFLHNEGANRVTVGGSVKWVARKTWIPVHERQKQLIAQLPPAGGGRGE
jgi:prepilin-type N-terminal cleavage/methylation domain-containing protein